MSNVGKEVLNLVGDSSHGFDAVPCKLRDSVLEFRDDINGFFGVKCLFRLL